MSVLAPHEPKSAQNQAVTSRPARATPARSGFARPAAPAQAPASAPALEVSRPDDEFEQEADRVAEQVLRAPTPPVAAAAGENPGGTPAVPPNGGRPPPGRGADDHRR